MKTAQTESQNETYEKYINIYAHNKEKPAKIIWEIYSGNKKNVLKATFFLLIRQSPVWALPILTANIINIATRPNDYSQSALYLNAGLGLFFLLQNVWAAYVQIGIYSKVTRGIELNLRGTMVHKLQELSIGFFQSLQSGRILSKIMRDVENVETLLRQGYWSLLNIILDITIAITVTALNSPIVLIFFLLSVPAAVITMKLFRTPVRKRNYDFRAKMEETQASMAEMVDMLPVTKAHGLEEVEVEKMEHSLRGIFQSGYHLDVLNTVFGATSWVIFQIFGLLCLTFTGTLAYLGKISVGEVILYQNYFTQIIGQVANLINLYPILTKGFESVRSIGDIISAFDVERSGGEIPLGRLRGKVEFEHVSYRYPKAEKGVIKDFTLSVKAGECVALVGGSGAGKSTILNLLIGFYTAQSGQIRIDGKDLGKIDLREFRSQIAVVPQNTILFSGTLYDNIAYGTKDVSKEQVEQMLDKVGLKAFVEQLPEGIYSRLDENGSNLSGGQKQRISIARALIRSPKLIIFDEATSALDSASEKKVQEAVDYMMEQCTIFMVAHRLSTVRNASKIVVLENGKVVESGSYEELMESKGAFYRMKKLQE